MDRPRADQPQQRRKRALLTAGIIVAVVCTTAGVAALKPAAPEVNGNQVWVDSVRRGPMLRQVRALGTLVPEEITWLAARTKGRVEKIVVRPGTLVQPDDVVLILSNPEALKDAADAEADVKNAEAELLSKKVELERSMLTAEADAASATARHEQAKLKADVYENLFRDGLISALDRNLTKVTVEQSAVRTGIERKRLAFARNSIAPQLAVKAAKIDRLRATAQLRREEAASLEVKAGMQGVLQMVRVEIGAQVEAGANLARVANPDRLRAEIRVAETQATAIALGQNATVDTRNGTVHGRVSRIDPSVQKSTVTVEIAFDGPLPAGARPDLSVEGIIEVERLENVLFVGRPAIGNDQRTIKVFRVDANGDYATRTQVSLGRSSVSTVEILGGLQAGDRIILSDMSRWEGNDRIRLDPSIPPPRPHT